MPTIIKVGGPSRAGKTTISLRIQSELEELGNSVLIIHMDEFVVSEGLMPLINDVIDWEHPKSIDLSKVISTMKQSQSDFMIIEGHLVFAFLEITSDKDVFIGIDREVFYKRKRDDTRWGKVEDWYIDHIWKSFFRYGTRYMDEQKTIHINGNKPFDVSKILEFICS